LGVKVLKLLIKQFAPASYYFIPLFSIPKHPQYTT
jgi:hypothetical protein